MLDYPSHRRERFILDLKKKHLLTTDKRQSQVSHTHLSQTRQCCTGAFSFRILCTDDKWQRYFKTNGSRLSYGADSESRQDVSETRQEIVNPHVKQEPQ